MKKLLFILLFTTVIFGQQKELSEPSKIISNSQFAQIDRDENQKALFKSGLGETVVLYPCQITDLKNNIKLFGLQVESNVLIGMNGYSPSMYYCSAFVQMSEINDLISWFELYVVPAIENNKSTEKRKYLTYVFNCKEIMFKFQINADGQIFSVILNNSLIPSKYFWTESGVKNIPNVITTLKFLRDKK